jgi:hypothetical protein
MYSVLELSTIPHGGNKKIILCRKAPPKLSFTTLIIQKKINLTIIQSMLDSRSIKNTLNETKHTFWLFGNWIAIR